MNYKEQLRDPRWQKQRLEIFNRDNWTCQRCNSSTKPLNIHHLVSRGWIKPWEYYNDELLTLCEECHEYESLNIERSIERLVYNVRTSGMLSDEINALAATHINPKAMEACDERMD
jgi:5-methylcytosine-specific restriction endonuclease McrA